MHNACIFQLSFWKEVPDKMSEPGFTGLCKGLPEDKNWPVPFSSPPFSSPCNILFCLPFLPLVFTDFLVSVGQLMESLLETFGEIGGTGETHLERHFGDIPEITLE